MRYNVSTNTEGMYPMVVPGGFDSFYSAQVYLVGMIKFHVHQAQVAQKPQEYIQALGSAARFFGRLKTEGEYQFQANQTNYLITHTRGDH